MSAAVVAQSHPADDAQDGIAVGDGVVESPQCQDGRALGGDQSVGAVVEGPGSAGAAQRLQGGEADVQQQIAGAVDAAGEHDVGGAVVQAVAGQFDRVQRRGAGGVECGGAAGQAQGLRDQMRRQPRHESIARIGGGFFAAPDGFGEVGHALRGIAEVAQDDAGGTGQFADPPTGAVEGLPGRFHSPRVERVEAGEVLGGQQQPARVEDAVEAADVAAPVRPGVVELGWVGRVAEHACRGDAPVVRFDRPQCVASVADGGPQFSGVQAAGQHTALPDDRDGIKRHLESTAVKSAAVRVQLESLEGGHRPAVGVEQIQVADGPAGLGVTGREHAPQPGAQRTGTVADDLADAQR